MKNWIKTVCFLLWTCVMCTACIDDDVEEGTVDLQTGESIPVFETAQKNIDNAEASRNALIQDKKTAAAANGGRSAP